LLALDVSSYQLCALDWVGFLTAFDPVSRRKRQNAQRLSSFLRLSGISANGFAAAEGGGFKLRNALLSIFLCLLPPYLPLSAPPNLDLMGNPEIS